jgi:cbb3-type cytochrome oxidase subunit 3
MKIVSNLLETIEGIGTWYVIGLLIFFGMFIIFLVRTLRRPRAEMEEIKNAILDDGEISGSDNKQNIE